MGGESMLSRNNQKAMLRKDTMTSQRFALRKLTIGVASVLVGIAFAGYDATVSADVQNQNGGGTTTPANDQVTETNNLDAQTVKLEPTSEPLASPEATVAEESTIKPFASVKSGDVMTPVSGEDTGTTEPQQPTNPTMPAIGTTHRATIHVIEPDGTESSFDQSVDTYSFSGDGKGVAYWDEEATKPVGTSGYLLKDVELPTYKGMKAVVTDDQGMGYELYTKDGKTYLKLGKLENISGWSSPIDYTVRYAPNRQTVTVNYIYKGKIVKTQSVTGTVGDNVTVKYELPEHYEATTELQNPVIITDKPTPINVEVKHKIHHWTEKKTITYIINVDGKQRSKQDYTFTKEHNTDEFTGHDIGVAVWKGNSGWTQPNTYFKPGYATYINGELAEDGETTAHSIDPNLPKFSDPQNFIIDNINHKALPQSIHIYYKDGQNKTVYTQEVSGVTDQTVNINYKVPDGYFMSENNVPKTYTFKGGFSQNIIVNVKKKISQSGNPVTSSRDALNVINYVDENGKTIKADKVTGHDGDPITVSVPAGYHFVGTAPSLKINSSVPVQTVNVIKDQAQIDTPATSDKDVLNVINYVDENGKTIKTDKVTGHDGDPITVSAPAGYHFVGTMPSLKVSDSTPVQVVKVVADNTNVDMPIIDDNKPAESVKQSGVNQSIQTNDKQESTMKIDIQTLSKTQTESPIVTDKNNQSKQLPQTGNHNNAALVALGATSLLGMFGLAGLIKKHD